MTEEKSLGGRRVRERFGRRCRLCGVRRRDARTRTVEPYLTGVSTSVAGVQRPVTRTRQIRCDACQEASDAT